MVLSSDTFKFWGLLLVIMLSIISAQAQTPERIKSMRVAYLTRNLALTPAEAEKFWPVYNQFSDSVEKLKQEQRKRYRNVREDLLNKSDQELENDVDDFIAYKRRELEIFEEYHDKFKEVLPIRKVVLLYKAEQNFEKEIINQIRERLNNRNNARNRRN